MSPIARSPNGAPAPGSSSSRYFWTTLSSMGISAGRFGCSAFVIFERPTPRMSANPSKSWLSGSHGTELAAPVSDASGAIARRARSTARRRSRIAAISAAEMRAPPRFASLRSGSPNDTGRESSPMSKCQSLAGKPSTTCRGSSRTMPFRSTAGLNELLVTWLESGVAADEQDGSDRERDRRVAAQQAEAGPRSQVVPRRRRHDRLTRLQGEIGRSGVVPARRQHVHQRREDEHEARKRRDSAGGVAHDRPEPEAEEADDGEVERRADDRSRDVRIGERDVYVPSGEDRLADHERDQHGRDRQYERHEAVDDRLCPEHGEAPRNGGHRGADHPGGVLGRDHEDA